MYFKLRLILLFILICAASLLWYSIFQESGEGLKVAVLNVGQGDAFFIETESGKQVLIDGGPGRFVLSELGRVMPAYDKSIDLVVATHTDLDHLGGLVEVAKSYHIGQVLENGFEAGTNIFQIWEDLLKQKNIPRTAARAGDKIILDKNTRLDIFGPFEEDFTPLPEKANEVMIVAKLTFKNRSFLFMGDIGKGDEIRLAESSADLKSDVLKIAHHGSKYASTNFFLNKVTPEYAAISVGGRNIYGHPAPEVLERLLTLGIPVYRTDRDGRVTFLSDGVTISALAEGKKQ